MEEQSQDKSNPDNTQIERGSSNLISVDELFQDSGDSEPKNLLEAIDAIHDIDGIVQDSKTPAHTPSTDYYVDHSQCIDHIDEISRIILSVSSKTLTDNLKPLSFTPPCSPPLQFDSTSLYRVLLNHNQQSANALTTGRAMTTEPLLRGVSYLVRINSLRGGAAIGVCAADYDLRHYLRTRHWALRSVGRLAHGAESRDVCTPLAKGDVVAVSVLEGAVHFAVRRGGGDGSVMCLGALALEEEDVRLFVHLEEAHAEMIECPEDWPLEPTPVASPQPEDPLPADEAEAEAEVEGGAPEAIESGPVGEETELHGGLVSHYAPSSSDDQEEDLEVVDATAIGPP